MNNTTPNTKSPKSKMTAKRLAAIVGIIILVGIYVVTLVVALIYPPASPKLFGLCLFATLAIPILTWIYVWMYGKLTGKHTFADFELEKDK